MSVILPMRSPPSSLVAASFGARAASYEAHADLQREVAAHLAQLLPPLAIPRVLELGCGTGLFSRHLLKHYPNGEFLFTDIAPAMLEECRRNLGDRSRAAFRLLDANDPEHLEGPFDVIATSMTLHWLDDPAASLAKLRRLLARGGHLLYATLGPQSFAEWQQSVSAEGLPSGIVPLGPTPGIVKQDRMAIDAGALGFLRRMRAVGGLTPRGSYRALPPGKLRRAIRRLDAEHGGRVTWHIVYGRLTA